MTSTETVLDPVDHITADAIGKPGERVFYLQAKKDDTVVTFLIEKVQLQSLAIGARQFLQEIANSDAELEPIQGDYDEDEMHIQIPVEPAFRIGDLGLAFDKERDMVCLILKEITLEKKDEDLQLARLWCTRQQLLPLAHWSETVASRGRPICPQCLQPMEPEGHFCPKKNGRKH